MRERKAFGATATFPYFLSLFSSLLMLHSANGPLLRQLSPPFLLRHSPPKFAKGNYFRNFRFPLKKQIFTPTAPPIKQFNSSQFPGQQTIAGGGRRRIPFLFPLQGCGNWIGDQLRKKEGGKGTVVVLSFFMLRLTVTGEQKLGIGEHCIADEDEKTQKFRNLHANKVLLEETSFY